MLLTGCTATGQSERESWVGKTESELLASKGQPSEIHPHRRTSKIYYYTNSSVTSSGSMGSRVNFGAGGPDAASASGGSAYDLSTTQRFTLYYIDPDGIITKVISKMR